jgi:hypothetical protein
LSSSSSSRSSSETVNEQVKRIENRLSQQSKSNLNDMNFTEKNQLNKIKQQGKAIKADITKKELLILEIRRYIKNKNKLYDELINQENELSTTITFSSPSIEKTEEELKEEIANKIVKDRFLHHQDRVNYGDKEKDTNLQSQKSNEFQQI